MKKTISKRYLLYVSIGLLFLAASVSAQTTPSIQTNSATNVQNNSAVLNANIPDLGSSAAITIWFQWGTSTSYGNETALQSQGYTGQFSQTITGLSPNTTYHFRVASQNRYGTVYGNDMTFYTTPTVGGSNVQTNPATNIQNNQVTLNGYFSNPVLYGSSYVWFQWGTSTSYGNETTHQNIANAGSFNQNITGLASGVTYHFRAVAQTYGNTIYGSDYSFNTYGSGSGSITVSKKAINLSSGNLNWQSYVNANPSDILSFAITIQAPSNQDIHNVVVRDILPNNLTYKGNLTVNAAINYSENPSSGINVGTIPAGGVEVIAYQVQVASAASFSYGNTSLINSATVTGNEIGSQSASATVTVNNSAVSGATTISTGLTNSPTKDSFFFPVMLIILGSWLYFSGNIYKFADWLRAKI